MIDSYEIFDFLDTLAPKELAMDWDNSGLQIGSRKMPVSKVLVALDPFEDTCREAVSIGAQLIVTHHPLFFDPIQAITDETAVGRAAAILVQNGISLYSCHTNLDIAHGGVNDCLARALGLENVERIGSENLLRRGTVQEQPLEQFLEHVKARLGCPGLRYASGGKSCQKIAVGGGACADEIAVAAAAGCDTFVTSDVKYNRFWDAQDMGLNLIDAGHFYTENPVCAYLAEKIRGQFPNLTVQISQNHRDCMKFF